MHTLGLEACDSSVWDAPGFGAPSCMLPPPAHARPAPAARAPPAPGELVPWSCVEQALSMGAEALAAKQRAADVRRGPFCAGGCGTRCAG